jgi:hypothetical protein
MRLKLMSSIVAMLVAGMLVGCPNKITPIETRISPNVITIAKEQTLALFPENTVDWVSTSWMAPDTWWLSLPTSQLPRAGLNGVVGFNVLVDAQGSQKKFRKDLYRAGFRYDLTQQQSLKGLVTKAQLSFSAATLPSGVNATSLCQPLAGGAGDLIVLAPSSSLPLASLGMAFLGSTAAFPAGTRLFSIPQPLSNATSPIAPGITFTLTQGRAFFQVDVTNLVNAALNRSATELAFMISGSDEQVPTAFINDAQDCRTAYQIDELVITHL